MSRPLRTYTDAELIDAARGLTRRVAELVEDMQTLIIERDKVERQHELYRVNRKGYSWYRELEALRSTLYVMEVARKHWQERVRALKDELVRRGIATSSDVHRIIGEL